MNDENIPADQLDSEGVSSRDITSIPEYIEDDYDNKDEDLDSDTVDQSTDTKTDNAQKTHANVSPKLA